MKVAIVIYLEEEIIEQRFVGLVCDRIGRKAGLVFTISLIINGATLCTAAHGADGSPDGLSWFMTIARGVVGVVRIPINYQIFFVGCDNDLTIMRRAEASLQSCPLAQVKLRMRERARKEQIVRQIYTHRFASPDDCPPVFLMATNLPLVVRTTRIPTLNFPHVRMSMTTWLTARYLRLPHCIVCRRRCPPQHCLADMLWDRHRLAPYGVL